MMVVEPCHFPAAVHTGPAGPAPGPESASASPDKSAAAPAAAAGTTAAGKRVPLWNVVYRRRISGNSAPMEQNLEKYLARHPECEVYEGQDLPSYAGGDQEAKRTAALQALAARPVRQLQKRVTLWHKVHKRKVVGNAAPLEKNVDEYLRKHPEFELYDATGDKREQSITRAVERVLGAIVTSVCSAQRSSPSRTQRQRVARMQKPKAGAIGKRRPKTQRKDDVEDGQGVSLLLNIAMGQGPAPISGTSSDAEAFGLLDLLAVATECTDMSAPHAVPAAAKPTVPLGSPTAAPESPPFSPMQGPTQAEIGACKYSMPDLSIGAAHTRASTLGSFAL